VHVYVNNAKTTLAAGLGTGVTTMTVADASMLPALGDGEGIPMTLTHPSLPDTYEVVLVTDVSGAPDLIVQRSYENDQQDWPSGTDVRANITAGMLGVFLQQDEDTKVVRMRSGNGVLLGSVNASSTTAYSNSAVINGRSRMSNAVQISGRPVLQLAGPSGSGLDLEFSRVHVGGTIPVNLGNVAAWADGDYRRGSVVAPSTPDGYQYWLEIEDINADYLTISGEPAFSGDGNPVSVTGGTFWATPTPAVFTTNNMLGLVVTEVGFICQRYEASTPPTVSIGTDSAPTRYANAVSLASISGHDTVHRIPISAGGAIVNYEALRFEVTTPAAGGRCLGRFYWHGFFVELDSSL
jgi:hypothetical protein